MGSSTEAKMEKARTDSNFGRARDALMAVLSCLSSRSDYCWLGAGDGEKPVRGWFACYLVDPSTTFRISFLPKVPYSLPTALLITRLMPLQEALEQMDDGGPFFPRKPRTMCRSSGLEFAFQELVLGVDKEENPEKSRQKTSVLKPEPKLRALLASKQPIILMDCYAALAPREVTQRHGLGDVIKAELSSLLRESKAQGRGVLFQVAADKPHILAEKVYLQGRNAEFGLRCGYIRWRASATDNWAREK